MSANDKLKRARRWALAILAVLAMGAFATRPYLASETQNQFWDDTRQCLIWLLQDFPRHQAECIGPGLPAGTSKDVNQSGGSSDPCRGVHVTGAGIIGNPCDCYPYGGAGNAGNAGGGIPCPKQANLSGWLFDMFLPEEPVDTTYL